MFLGDAKAIVVLCYGVGIVQCLFNLLYYVIWWLITPFCNTKKLPEKLPRCLSRRACRLTFFGAGENVASAARTVLRRNRDLFEDEDRYEDEIWPGKLHFSYFHRKVNTVILKCKTFNAWWLIFATTTFPLKTVRRITTAMAFSRQNEPGSRVCAT